MIHTAELRRLLNATTPDITFTSWDAPNREWITVGSRGIACAHGRAHAVAICNAANDIIKAVDSARSERDAIRNHASSLLNTIDALRAEVVSARKLIDECGLPPQCDTLHGMARTKEWEEARAATDATDAIGGKP